jgi:hypothetical protein
MEREFHEVAELFPLLHGVAFEELVADIRKNGLREPILVDAEGRILDGRNRYRACVKAGVEPRFVQWEGEGALAELSLSLNLRRRHLDESQRAMVAARLAQMLQASRPARGANLHHGKVLRSHDQAATAVNVSRRLLMHASKVVRSGCGELIAAVEAGKVAVSTASRLTALPPNEQAEAVADGAKARAAPTQTGTFGVVCLGARERDALPKIAGADEVGFLWVASDGLAAAIETLKKRGFRFVR